MWVVLVATPYTLLCPSRADGRSTDSYPLLHLPSSDPALGWYPILQKMPHPVVHHIQRLPLCQWQGRGVSGLPLAPKHIWSVP